MLWQFQIDKTGGMDHSHCLILPGIMLLCPYIKSIRAFLSMMSIPEVL